MQINAEYQENVFNAILNMKYRMQELAGYIQNDFEKMFDANIATKENVIDEMKRMNAEYDSVITEINELRIEANNILLYRINNNNDIV
jgi:predicted nuclease with TOPRIM domain